MKRSLLSIGMWMFACAMACAQACVPGGGVTCTSNINLWIIPANYLNWNVPVDDNTQLIDNWSATVLLKAGGTMTGPLLLSGDPTSSTQAATKHYVDTLINSFTLGATSISLGTTTTAVTGLTVDGVTPTTFGYLDATSSIQTQLNSKAGSGANTDIISLNALTTPITASQGACGTHGTGYIYGNGTGNCTFSTTVPVGSVTGAAPLASPAFTGTPAAPTAALNTNTTQVATTAFVLAQGAQRTSCGTGTTCTVATLTAPLKDAYGAAALTGGAATVTGIPAFSSTATMACSCEDTTAGVSACSAVPASASSVTLAGTSTDTVAWHCFGN